MKPCGAFYRPQGSVEPLFWVVSAEYIQFEFIFVQTFS